jgi:hypothetical protein
MRKIAQGNVDEIRSMFYTRFGSDVAPLNLLSISLPRCQGIDDFKASRLLV